MPDIKSIPLIIKHRSTAEEVLLLRYYTLLYIIAILYIFIFVLAIVFFALYHYYDESLLMFNPCPSHDSNTCTQDKFDLSF